MIRPALWLLVAMIGATLAGPAMAAPVILKATLTGPSESPPNDSPGTGSARVRLDDAAHSIRIQVNFSGLLGDTAAAHIHAPTSAPGTGVAGVATQVPSFVGFPLGVTSGNFDSTFDTSLASFYNPSFISANGGSAASAEAALFASLLAGTAYFNIHTASFPSGEIRGFLNPVPLPGAVALLAPGLALLALAGGRRAKARAAAAR
jgi:hypothetical protein